MIHRDRMSLQVVSDSKGNIFFPFIMENSRVYMFILIPCEPLSRHLTIITDRHEFYSHHVFCDSSHPCTHPICTCYTTIGTMLGGFSSKNGPASFAFPSNPPPPRTITEWKAAISNVKDMYQKRQYKQCANRCMELLAISREPVCCFHLKPQRDIKLTMQSID